MRLTGCIRSIRFTELIRLNLSERRRYCMKKIAMLIVYAIVLMTAVTAFAQNYTWECDPAVSEETRETTTCWYYDEAGEKALNPAAGYAGKTEVYEPVYPEDEGSLVLTEYLDTEGNLIMIPDGYARMTAEYELQKSGEPLCWYDPGPADPEPRICGTTWRFFGPDGEPVLIEEAPYIVTKGLGFPTHFAAYTQARFWSGDEFVRKYAYYGTDGELMLLQDKGYAVFERAINDYKTEYRYFGPDGSPIDPPDGYARTVVIHDLDDEMRGTHYYTADGQMLPDEQYGIYAFPWPYHNPGSTAPAADLKGLQVGDEFTFGTYEQDNDPENGWEPIEWQVLAAEEDRILVISKYGLDNKPFSDIDNAGKIWETSGLRAWLNGAFYENVFSPEEKEQIAVTELVNPAGKTRSMNAGKQLYENPTEDRIFLLSIDELEAYFSDNTSMICQPTPYAVPNVHLFGIPPSANWLLRTEGESLNRFIAVGAQNGWVEDFVKYSQSRMIRPAFWLNR